MIKSLKIQNFVLIDVLDIEFTEGLNIIIGETGSGKSMLADAMLLLFGGRASADFVRNGANKAILETELDYHNNSSVEELLKSNDIEIYDHNTIIIRREINSKGISRTFINDSPVNLSVLKSFGDLLIDFHGQHDHQSLLDQKKHIEIFDSIYNQDILIHNYHILRDELSVLINDYTNLQQRESDLINRKEKISFQLKEIMQVDPKPDEDSILERELEILENAEQIIIQCNECYESLYSADNSVYAILARTKKIIENLSKFDFQFNQYSGEVQSAEIIIKEASVFLNDYVDKLNFDQAKIEDIRLRLYAINNLKRKYGTLSEIIELRDKVQKELDESDNFQYSLREKRAKIDDLKREIAKVVTEISEKRRKNAIVFERLVSEKLQIMGIQNATFKVNFNFAESDADELLSIFYNGKQCKLLESGIDELEFYISTNIGELPTPLSNVASGGEVSRIMLAIKSIMAENDTIPILVFDEIDTGISGRIAQKVGLVMKDLAKFHQIIAITHLPQIAALGEQVLLVRKFEDNIRTWIESTLLTENEKINEIAKMISGELVSDAAIESAKVLINSSV